MSDNSITPMVSFVMPIYGVEDYLNECVDSVLNQTFGDFELILVDDGSPDKCGEICDEYAKNDKRVKVIHKENEGVSEARNTGLRAACGQWAYIIDSDDWLEPDALKKMYTAAISNNVDCVMSDVLVHYPKTQKRGYLFAHEFVATDSETIGKIQKFILCHKYSPYYTNKTINGFAAPWSKLVKMSIIKDNEVYFDPYVKGRFDDGLWSLHMLDYVSSVCYIQEVTYNYRNLSSSITHSYKPQALDIIERGFKKTQDWINATEKDYSFMQAHYGRVCMFLALQLSQYFFNPMNEKTNKERTSELRTVLKREPYKTAIKKVDFSKLETKHKYVVICARMNAIWGMKLYVCLKEIKMGKLQ